MSSSYYRTSSILSKLFLSRAVGDLDTTAGGGGGVGIGAGGNRMMDVSDDTINAVGEFTGDEQADPIKDALGWIGSFIVILLFLSPIKDVLKISKLKSTAHLASGLPYFATLFNCAAWVCYTVPAFSEYVLPAIINSFGLLLNLGYSSLYWKYVTSKIERENCMRYSVAGSVFLIVALICEFLFGRLIMGYFAAVLNVIMFYGPLGALGQVMITKSSEKMPFLPILFGFLCSIIWCAYGVHTNDLPIIIPNGCGILLGSIQLFIFFIYRSTSPNQIPQPI